MPTRLVLGSLLMASALIAGLRGGPATKPPLALAVAASLRPVAEAIAADFTHQTGRQVEIRSGGSEQLLMQLGREPCDLFLPADAGYVQRATADKLVSASFPLARMKAVVVAPRRLTWPQLVAPDCRIALARPETAAIGRQVREHLTRSGHWSELNRVVTASPETVTACLTAVRLNAADAAIVWDVVARTEPRLIVSELPELSGVEAQVTIAPCRNATDPDGARELVAFFRDAGRNHFAAAGFVLP